jgi:hypothetical protein
MALNVVVVVTEDDKAAGALFDLLDGGDKFLASHWAPDTDTIADAYDVEYSAVQVLFVEGTAVRR